MTTPAARPTRAPRGRPRAMPDDQLRDRMFTAAQQMLDAAGGFTLSTENVQLESVMRRADVSRSAVYRVWPTKEDFAFELLVAFASNGAGGVEPFDPSGRELAATLVDRPESQRSDCRGDPRHEHCHGDHAPRGPWPLTRAHEATDRDSAFCRSSR